MSRMVPATPFAEQRAQQAYASFRGGLHDIPFPVPHWDDAPAWVRDVVLVAYLQGNLDGSWSNGKQVGCEQ